ncbi:MAG: sodium:solute symporter [Niastella sp. SCN 39-18]|nr:sodium:solute symporter [Sphingobacteriales bacterium]ODT53315.1 MAG: sodium:solute symporter [Niastella sp. SCN 39-18]OJW08580.1 MAG: sodium:solute symporter [Sphingobacteriales bacterium 39-19]
MSPIDWIIMITVLAAIILYGVYISRKSKNLDAYFLSNRSMPWYLVLLGIMGTQASAVTYLSGPGQAYTDGMRFVQYYFGLPFAMIVISLFFVPVFNKLKVYTAYEFIEKRFDGKTRSFTAFLFLVSRGLSTGISIYAPSIVLSSLMGWDIYITNIIMGGMLLIYTMSGGARAVAHTQMLQMLIVFITLILVFIIIIHILPGGLSFSGAVAQAKELGKMNVITTGIDENGFNWNDKYNIWSGLIGGFFLALSYFGTDHSQVGRYITAKNVKESQRGLLMNGLVKVPMQFMILLLGVLVFVFYVHTSSPVYFNKAKKEAAMQTAHADTLSSIEAQYHKALAGKNTTGAAAYREAYKQEMDRVFTREDNNDTNFIFLEFVKDHLPKGLIGLLFAVIFLSAWGSIAAALNALAACTVVDFHKRYTRKKETDLDEVKLSKWYTFGWGIFCIIIAMFANNIGNSLIEAVNILGSLFYGVILGIFLMALWVKSVKANAVFYAAIISEIIVIVIYKMEIISFLWLNAIGAGLVLILGFFLQHFSLRKKDCCD